jgi:integrase
LNTIGQIQKKGTTKNYEILLTIFNREYGDREINSITSDEVMGFLNRLGEGTKQATKKFRYALLKAFFNFIRNTVDETLANPCDTLILRKLFREPKIHRWDILEKDLVDEMIFRTRNRRDRLMLELMARGGMRIGEVLKIRAGDVIDQKIILQDPKSGKESEAVYIPKKVAERLKEYLRDRDLRPNQRIFPFGYSQGPGISY